MRLNKHIPEAENMDKRWSAVFLLTLVLCVFVALHSAAAQKQKTLPGGTQKDRWIVKRGACPRINWGAGLCAEFCSSDIDCENNQKCCSNGCGHQCMEPYKVKRGRCPLPKGTHMCAEFCHHDGECPGEQKCCRTSCGHACTEVQPC